MRKITYTVHEMDTNVLTYFEVTSRRWEVRSSSLPSEPFCSFCSHYGARKIADALNRVPVERGA